MHLGRKMYELTHHPVIATSLLNAYIQLANDSRTKEVNRIVDKAANLIAIFYFVNVHTEQILPSKFRHKPNPAHRYFAIQDYTREFVTELFHSLLLARNGLLLQAIHSLRRSVEVIVYGSFLSLSQLTMKNGNEINPFMLLEGSGVWSQSAGRALVRRSDLKNIVPVGQTEDAVLRDFTRNYIEHFSHHMCSKHAEEVSGWCRRPMDDSGEFGLRCKSCGNPAQFVSFNRVPTLSLMIDIICEKLGDSGRSAEIAALYSELSKLVHPNPLGHQHSPGFTLKKQRLWYKLLLSTLHVALWAYSETLEEIQCYDQDFAQFLRTKSYRLECLNRTKLWKTYCSKVAAGYKGSGKTHVKKARLNLSS